MLISLAINRTDPTGQIIVGIMVMCFGYCLADLQQTMHIIHKECASCILVLSLFVVISITADGIPIYAVLTANIRRIVNECKCIKEQHTIIGAILYLKKLLLPI